jgi:hypothetical protein
MQIMEWIKSHKLTCFLSPIIFLFLIFFVFAFLAFVRNLTGANRSTVYKSYDSSLRYNTMGSAGSTMPTTSFNSLNYEAGYDSGIPNPVYDNSAPVDINTPPSERKSIQSSYLSLKVKNVAESILDIKLKVNELGGFLVNSDFANTGEDSTGTIVIRVPVDKNDEALAYLRNVAVNVVSESQTGFDVTEQYTDLNSQLETLNNTKIVFEDMFVKAKTIDEILRVQREILNIQRQIDSVRGQVNYLENSSESVKITAYLATDQYALPYKPETGWKAGDVYKEAVRSLVLSLRSFATTGIWIAVYAVIWIPMLVIAYLFIRLLIKLIRKGNKALA